MAFTKQDFDRVFGRGEFLAGADNLLTMKEVFANPNTSGERPDFLGQEVINVLTGEMFKATSLTGPSPFSSLSGGILVSVAANALIVFDGDSTVAGLATGGGATQVINSIPMKLADLMTAAGTRASAQNRFGCASGSWAALLAMDGRVTGSGAWSQNATLGPGGNSYGVSTGAAGAMNFVPQGSVTKLDIYWRDGAAGRNFSYGVDGGATTQVNSSGTTQIAKTTVPAGSAASHAIALAWVAGNVTILGIDAYDDTLGMPLRIWNWGISGGTSTQMIDNSDPQGGRRAFATYAKPDLTIIEGGPNDWRQNVPVATFKANIITRAQTALSAKAGAKVMLLTPPFDNDLAQGNTANQDQYVTAVKEVGTELNLPVYDTRVRDRSWAYANSQGWMSDTIHRTAAGNLVQATDIRGAIAIAA